MINAFIVTTPGQRSQRVEFDGTSEFAAIRAHRQARKLATHRLAKIVVEVELDGFDVPCLVTMHEHAKRNALPTLGQALKQARAIRRMRPEQFAGALGVPVSRLRSWESGLVVPSKDVLERLLVAVPGLGELMRGERRAG